MERDGRPVPARVLLPARHARTLPAWIVLHGVTRPGLDHPQLVRFARALAASGALVFIPEVPEWKDLRLAPEATLPTVLAAIRALDTLPEARQGPYGLMGFSFGGPQALITASHDSVADRLAGVVSFGGFYDLQRTLHFQFTGEHGWQGRTERLSPDPYGRWVVGATYLTAAAGYADAGDVARALWELAAAAGERRAPAWSPEYDALKTHLRANVARQRRDLFDAFAPPSERAPDAAVARELVGPLTEAGRRVSPLMEAAPFMQRVRHRVHLLHGRGDRLIPYTESLRMREQLPRGVQARLTVTRLFAHSTGERLPPVRGGREAWALFQALRHVLGTL